MRGEEQSALKLTVRSREESLENIFEVEVREVGNQTNEG